MIENLPQDYVDATQGPQEEQVEEAPVEQTPDESVLNEQSTEQITQAAPVEAPRRESDQEYNIRRIREEREQYQRERDELAYRLSQIEKQTKQQQAVEEEPLAALGDSDLVEGKHFSKVGRELKSIKQELQKYQQQVAETALEAQVRRQYPDFDKIVTPANIDELKRRYPSVAATIAQATNTYNQASSAYELIKSLGIAQQERNPAEKQAITNNLQKPRTSAAATSAYGNTPLSHANAFQSGTLSDDDKQKLYREMMDLSSY